MEARSAYARRPELRTAAPERDVERNPARGLDEQNPTVEREPNAHPAGVRVVSEDGIDELFFAAETCKQRQIDVAGLAGFAPPLRGEAADDAALPTATGAQCLDLDGDEKEGVHGAKRACTRSCQSTNPDH